MFEKGKLHEFTDNIKFTICFFCVQYKQTPCIGETEWTPFITAEAGSICATFVQYGHTFVWITLIWSDTDE